MGVSVGHLFVPKSLKGCLHYSTVNIKKVSLICHVCCGVIYFSIYNRGDWYVTKCIWSPRIYHGAICARHLDGGCCCITVCHLSICLPCHNVSGLTDWPCRGTVNLIGVTSHLPKCLLGLQCGNSSYSLQAI